MPYVKKSKKTRKRTRWSDAPTSRQDYESALASAGSMLFNTRVPNTPLPRKLKANLRFCEKNLLNIGLGGLAATNVYNAASLYDPNTTGVGAQPRGFDEIMALYRRFIVIGSKITVHVMPGDTIGPVLGAIGLKAIATQDNSMVTTGESSFTSIYSTTGQTGAIKMMQTYSPKFIGVTNPMDADDLYGTSTSDPSNGSYFHVVLESAATNDEATIAIFTIIEYTAIFMDPVRPSQS